jgi:hypothetical protein
MLCAFHEDGLLHVMRTRIRPQIFERIARESFDLVEEMVMGVDDRTIRLEDLLLYLGKHVVSDLHRYLLFAQLLAHLLAHLGAVLKTVSTQHLAGDGQLTRDRPVARNIPGPARRRRLRARR